MRILVLNSMVPFVRGGAETHAANLVENLRLHGHDVDLARIPFKWYPPERIADHLFACRMLDLSEANGQSIDLVIPMKFPVYAVRHPNKVVWLLHQHRAVYDSWGSDFEDMRSLPGARQMRELVMRTDSTCLREARAVFANSKRVAERLLEFNGIASEPLYHPPGNAELFREGPAGDYLYLPSRINRSKRQYLAVEALASCRAPVRLVISGPADRQADWEEVAELARALGVDDRVEYRGAVSEEEKFRLYSECIGVAFVAEDEDYGYVPLEAMLSSKPVVTCNDSGGPLAFVRDGLDGFVCEPRASSLAQAFDRLYDDRAGARRMGESGRARYDSLKISWAHVVETLTKGY